MRAVAVTSVVPAISAFLEDCWRGVQLVLVFLIAAGTFGLPPAPPSAFTPSEELRLGAPLSGDSSPLATPANESRQCTLAAYPE